MDFPAVSQLEGYASGKITGVVFSRVEFRLGFIEIVLYGKFPVKGKNRRIGKSVTVLKAEIRNGGVGGSEDGRPFFPSDEKFTENQFSVDILSRDIQDVLAGGVPSIGHSQVFSWAKPPIDTRAAMKLMMILPVSMSLLSKITV